MNSRYRDIIALPHPVSRTRAQMPVRDRAAQFAPFAALTGFDGVIAESARTTSEKPELSEDMEEQLDLVLRAVVDRIGECPKVEITYFVRDKLKSGGAYERAEGFVKRIGEVERTLCLTDGRTVPIDAIIRIVIGDQR